MKTTSALAFAMVIALGGASLAQTGGAAGGSSGGAASSGAGGAVGAAPGTGSGGPSMGGGVNASTTATTTNAPATGGLPSTPGALNNQLQSNQNQQTGTNARNSGSQFQSSTLGTGIPRCPVPDATPRHAPATPGGARTFWPIAPITSPSRWRRANAPPAMIRPPNWTSGCSVKTAAR